MFFRSFAVPTIALLAAVSQVQAHSFISPGLGVAGAGARSDVSNKATDDPIAWRIILILWYSIRLKGPQPQLRVARRPSLLLIQALRSPPQMAYLTL